MKTEERKHRRWLKGEPGDIEHNALYDAWEAAEARCEAQEQLIDTQRRVKNTLEARIRELEVAQSADAIRLDAANAAIAEATKTISELKHPQPPGVPDVEALAELGWNAHNQVTGREDFLFSGANQLQKEAAVAFTTAVREAVEKPLRAEIERLTNEVITSEVLRKQHAHHVEVLSKYFQCGAPYAHFGTLGGNLVDALPKLVDRYRGLEAECYDLRAKLEAAEKQRDDAHADKIRAEKELGDAYLEWSSKSTTTRAARVRFTVTAEEAVKKKTSLFRRAKTTFFDDMCEFLDYLAAHAVIDVPEGVPSAEEVAKMLCAKSNISWEAITPLGREGRIEAAQDLLDVLAPYLQPAASVDPTLCEENWCKVWPPSGHAGEAKILLRAGTPEIDGPKEAGYYIIDVYGDSGGVETFVMPPEDAHRAGMWLLSFAASQGIDVRLPVRPQLTPCSRYHEANVLTEDGRNIPFSQMRYEQLAEIGTKAAQEEAKIGGREHVLDSRRYSVAFAKAVCVAVESERHSPEPIAPTETLEQLAEIAARAYWMEGFDACYDDEVRQRFTRAVTAILRAARAYCDVHVSDVENIYQTCSGDGGDDYFALLDLCNSRIRYRVEVPDAPSADTRQQQRECYERVWEGRVAHEWNVYQAHTLALQAARTLPERLAELDAALEEKP